MRTFDMEILEEVDSTNEYLKRSLPLHSRNFYAVRAIRQTRGKGRHTRKWQMQPNKDLAFSFVLRTKTPSIPAGITLAVGLGVHRVIRTKVPHVRLKWPNDLVCEGLKLGGILCESLLAKSGPIVIAGVGMNVNSEVESVFGTPATSLKLLTGLEWDLDRLTREILQEMVGLLPYADPVLNDFLMQEYTQHCDSLGRRVSFSDESSQKVGVAEAIDSSGALLVRLEDGSVVSCTDEADFL